MRNAETYCFVGRAGVGPTRFSKWLHGRQVTSYDGDGPPWLSPSGTCRGKPFVLRGLGRAVVGRRHYQCLIGLADGNAVETVLMEHDYGQACAFIPGRLCDGLRLLCVRPQALSKLDVRRNGRSDTWQ